MKPIETFVLGLKKDFLSEPVSKKVEVGSSVELQCRPPEGEPTPKVYWLKDKVPIQQQQTNQGNHYVIGKKHYITVQSHGCLMQKIMTDINSIEKKAKLLQRNRSKKMRNWLDYPPLVLPPFCLPTSELVARFIQV